MDEIKEKITKEGNEFDFEAYGLKCYMRRHLTLGHWCGYVQIPENSKLSNAKTYYYTDSELGLSDYEEAINNILVHGGITYSGDRKKDGSIWWGFDCGHAGDVSPFLETSAFPDAIYRDKEYVIEECKNLARQIKKISETYN